MRKIFVISDTHFGHDNILKFTGADGISPVRSFASTKEMDDCMVTNWNETVTDQDIVYHLGDVCFGNWENNQKILRSLKGRKRLLLGNHDDVNKLLPYFQKVMLWRMFPELDCVLTHIPIHMDEHSSKRKGKYHFNIHGHIHDNPAPTLNHCCVSVEQTGFKPVDLEEVMSNIKRT